MVTTLTPQTALQDRVAALRESRLKEIRLSIVVTVFTETFSIRETLDTLLGNTVGIPLKAPAALRALHGEDDCIAT